MTPACRIAPAASARRPGRAALGQRLAILVAGLVAVMPAHAQTPCTPGNYFLAARTHATGGYAIAPAVADFDENGIPDIAVANFSGSTISVLRGAGEGHFLPAGSHATPSGPTNLAVADVTGDGILDVVVTLFQTSDLFLLRGDGSGGTWSGTFTGTLIGATAFEPRDLAVGDFNEDGAPDVAVASTHGLAIHLGTGGGAFGTFVLYPASGAWDLALGDFDGDGVTDAAVSRYAGSIVSVFRGAGSGGLGDGTFHPPASTALAGPPTDIVAADLNLDGRTDLAASLDNSRMAILLNTSAPGAGSVSFGQQTTILSGSPSGIAAGDVDSDQRPDLVVANAYLGRFELLINQFVPGTFASGGSYATGGGAVGIVLADLDGNGGADAVTANTSVGTATVSMSTCPAGPAPPLITDVQPRIGRIGTRVTITGANFTESPSVRFGSVAVTAFETVLNGSMVVLVPDGAATAPVTVTTAHGEATTSFDFVIGVLPVLTSVQPTSGQAGDVVTLTGLHLAGTNQVSFAGNAAALFTAVSDTELSAIVPGAATSGPITVTTAIGSVTSSFAFTVLPPTPLITEVAPRGGRIGDAVTISGLNFIAPLEVRFGGVPVTAYTSILVSRIVVTVPPGAATGPITVTTPGGTATTPYEFFVGGLPVIASAEPPAGKIGSTVELRGSSFTGATRVSFQNGNSSATFTVLADDRIRAIVDPGATTGVIRVTTPAATGASSFVFTVLPYDTAARIVRLRDVPNDQGGYVVLNFLRSDFDSPPLTWITGYRVWRRAPEVSSAAIPAAASAPWARRDATAFAALPGYWEPVATLPAGQVEGYAATVATTRDSLEGSNPPTWLVVQTLTDDPFVFFFSAPDSAYSVDNLAPARPYPFTGRYEPSGGVSLHWTPNREADLGGYRLHRGGSATFVPSDANLVAVVADTTFFDPAGTLQHHYRIGAVDVHGNLSRFSLVSPNGPTAALASVARLAAEPDRVSITWALPDDPSTPVTVYRRRQNEEWTSLGLRFTDGSGRLEFADADVSPGVRYAYRLGLRDGDGEMFAGEAWVTVPDYQLALTGIHPNPSRGAVPVVRFTLPEPGDVTMTLYDAAGRRIASHRMAGLGAGRHDASFRGLPSLPAGVYLVGLDAAGKRLHARIVMLE